ncbi:MAG TPA: response regulator [Verrucomicrobiae bacterium]|jgi:CheY-like chemotaxis protein|nr:response regulator [Verrucomicrobiae bacterium]
MKLFGKWRNEPVAQPKEELPFVGSGGVAPGDRHAQPGIGSGRKILVVDDNPVVLKAFELKLKALGFTVLTATEGATAVSTARAEQPDLIVLDINFPPDVGSAGLQWNGFNIMQWMQRFQEAAGIPVIIITGSDPERFRERALAAGAVAFFQKPINNEEFLLTVRRVLGGQNEAKAKTA